MYFPVSSKHWEALASILGSPWETLSLQIKEPTSYCSSVKPVYREKVCLGRSGW